MSSSSQWERSTATCVNAASIASTTTARGLRTAWERGTTAGSSSTCWCSCSPCCRAFTSLCTSAKCLRPSPASKINVLICWEYLWPQFAFQQWLSENLSCTECTLLCCFIFRRNWVTCDFWRIVTFGEHHWTEWLNCVRMICDRLLKHTYKVQVVFILRFPVKGTAVEQRFMCTHRGRSKLCGN